MKSVYKNPIVIFLILLILAIGVVAGYSLIGQKASVVAPSAVDSITLSENSENVAVKNDESPVKAPIVFDVSVYAKDLPNVRVILFDPAGNLLASLPAEGQVVALVDRDKDGQSEARVSILAGLRRPHGLALDCVSDQQCNLYVAEGDKVEMYDYDPSTTKVGPGKKIIDLPTGGSHTTRSLLIADYNGKKKLFVSMGSTCNVCREKDERRAAIYASELNGSDFKPFAKGLRNSVFMAIDPSDGKIWATEMGRDLLGDNLPPEEINIIEEGGNYGWPICYGKNIHDTNFDKNTYVRNPCMEPFEKPSYIDLPAHTAPLGIAFFPKQGWPEDYQNDVLVAMHGSWNSSVPVGYKIVRIKRDGNGKVSGIDDFLKDWPRDNSNKIGRPVGLIISPEGFIYFSDDSRGMIYRVFQKEN